MQVKMRSLLFLPVSLLTYVHASPLSKRIPQNFVYAAFGDSFSAGIGAGTFVGGSADGLDNKCARMTEAYPAQLKNTFLREKVSQFDFLSCSGDVLDDIDGQVAKLIGNKIDVASLSISGNDFNFGNVVVSASHLRSLGLEETPRVRTRSAIDHFTYEFFRPVAYTQPDCKSQVPMLNLPAMRNSVQHKRRSTMTQSSQNTGARYNSFRTR